MIKRIMVLFLILTIMPGVVSCAESGDPQEYGASPAAEMESVPGVQDNLTEEEGTEIQEKTMDRLTMYIGETEVEVEWEDNRSVEELKILCLSKPLEIRMSMYGGFEQVGPVGTELPSDDVQTVTQAGDIVLYDSNQIVVFYGSNSWAYTRLGHITDRSGEEMELLLGNGDVTVTFCLDETE
jgi:hypothetical protein